MPRTPRLVWTLGLAFCVFSSPNIVANDCPKMVGRWPWGPTYTIAAAGGVAYYGSGAAFMVADVSSPTAPVVVGSVLLSSGIEDIAVQGDHAYVLGTNARLNVIDVSNPSRPLMVSTTQMPRCIQSCALEVVENLALVGTSQGLTIVDVTNPQDPVQVGTLQQYFGDVWDIAVAPESMPALFVYLMDYLGLQIVAVDVDHPETPTQVGSLQYPGRGVAVSGDYAYVARFWNPDSPEVCVIDVSNPGSPNVVGVLDDDNDYLDVEVRGSYVYAGGSALSVIDVSEPSSPAILGSVDAENAMLWTIADSGDTVVAAGGVAVLLIDVASPSEPTIVSSNEMPGYALGAQIAGDHMVAHMDPEGLHVFNIARPRAPTEIGSCNLEIFDYDVSWPYAFVLGTDRSAGAGGLITVDLSDPAAPVLANVLEYHVGSPPSYQAIATTEAYAYVASRHNHAFQIIDITDPMSPEMRGTLPIVDATAVAVLENYAYVTHYGVDYNGGLYVVDVSDPDEPIEVGYASAPRPCCSNVVAKNGWAFAVSVGGIRVFDVRDPTQPVLVHVISVPRSQVVGLAGDLLLVDSWASPAPTRALSLFDVSNPLMPVEVGFRQDWSGNYCNGAAFYGPFAFVSNGDLGVVIFDISSCPGFKPALPRPRRSSGARLTP